jgi:hypothetical protein
VSHVRRTQNISQALLLLADVRLLCSHAALGIYV